MLDMPLEAVLKARIVKHVGGFNPSYAGYASGRHESQARIQEDVRFQSFLCWICLWKMGKGKWSCSSRKVSILLMLDMPLEVTCTLSWRTPIICFNPSYAGYASGSRERAFGETLKNSFNPSYAGYASGSRMASDLLRDSFMFQSFLCWICLWKFCFIFSFSCTNTFQSFLCWICLWKKVWFCLL